jgi:hypothetical protein
MRPAFLTRSGEGMTMAERKTPAEVAAALRARASLIEQREAAKNRKTDAKRKIVIGGTVIAMMAEDAELKRRVIDRLREMTADRPADRKAVADLIGNQAAAPKSKPEPTPGG